MMRADSPFVDMPRRQLLRLTFGALAGGTVLAARRVAHAASVCVPSVPNPLPTPPPNTVLISRQCDWPAGTPATDLGKLGKAIILDNNRYNLTDTVEQLAYWDETYQWSKKIGGGWAFKKQTIDIERAIRIPYVGAKHETDVHRADEHLLIGLDRQPEDKDGPPQNAVTFMTDATPEPTDPFEKLAWLVLRVTSPGNASAWSAAPGWAGLVAIDTNGADWPLRGRRLNVEGIVLFKLFVTLPAGLFRARLLVGYEGSGGW